MTALVYMLNVFSLPMDSATGRKVCASSPKGDDQQEMPDERIKHALYLCAWEKPRYE